MASLIKKYKYSSRCDQRTDVGVDVAAARRLAGDCWLLEIHLQPLPVKALLGSSSTSRTSYGFTFCPFSILFSFLLACVQFNS